LDTCPNCGNEDFQEHLEKWGMCLWCFWSPGEELYTPLFMRRKRKPEKEREGQLKLI
jgi:hypothetical protein